MTCHLQIWVDQTLWSFQPHVIFQSYVFRHLNCKFNTESRSITLFSVVSRKQYTCSYVFLVQCDKSSSDTAQFVFRYHCLEVLYRVAQDVTKRMNESSFLAKSFLGAYHRVCVFLCLQNGQWCSRLRYVLSKKLEGRHELNSKLHGENIKDKKSLGGHLRK